MNVTKKILVVLLSTAMLLCSLPMNAFATTADIATSQNSDKYEDTIGIGDCITLGTYLGESIVWRCVDIDENGPLMLSEKIIALKAFDANGEDAYYHSDGWGYIRKRYGSNCWEDSNLRQWLNSDETQVSWSHCPPASGTVTYNPYSDESGFLTGFSNEEKSCIKIVTQPVNVNIWETKRSGYCEGGQSDGAYGNVFKSDFNITNYYYKNITDSVFLLTSSQIHRIHKNNPEYLLASPTQKAVDQSDYKGADVASNIHHDYWVNIPWGNNYACYENTMRITESGQLVNENAYKGYVGVRPAFYLNLDNYDDSYDVNDGDQTGSNPDVYFSGILDNGLSWEVSDNSLTIRGIATSIPSFKVGEAPWSQHASRIREIFLFTEYVETIGAYSFCGLNNVGYINIASDSLTHVGKYAFGGIKTNIDVWFFGTEKQWKDVKIDYGNDTLIGSDVFCSKTSTTVEGEHISIPSENYSEQTFLDEHLSFVRDDAIVAMMKDNSFSSVAVIKKSVLNAYNVWDVLGDVGEVVSLKFDDLTINADYYEMYLSDMILALNNEEEASKLEWKVAEVYNDVYGALKKLLQSSDEWESSVTPSMAKEIEDYLTGKSFELGDNTAKVLEMIFKDLYKNNNTAFTSVFEGLSTASTVLDGVFAAFDVVNAYVDAYNAYVVSKAFYEVNDEFFDVCINAGKRLCATSDYRQYGKWFLNAVYEAKSSEIGNLSIIFDSAHQLTKSGTVVVYNLFIQEFAKAAVYPTVAKLLGLTSAGQLSILAFTYNATYGILDALTGLSKASIQYKILNYITPVEKQLSNIVDSKRNSLLNNQSERNAISYDMAYRILRQTNMYLYEATYKHAAIKNNTNDMTYATAGKILWKRTQCHSGDYGEKYNIFSARCPVDVYVYDSNGVLITSIVNENIEEYDERITVMTGNGHKSFAYSSDEEFTFVIKAREEGEMDYSFGTLNATNLETEYVSYDIALVAEQEFSVIIPVSEDNSSDDLRLNTNGTQIDFDYSSTTLCDEHSFGEWNIDKESKSRVCDNCGYVEYIAVCSHNFDTIEVYSIVPTCNNGGHTKFVCSCCGADMSDGVDVGSIGHIPDENSIITEPSCTEGGYTTHTCSICGENYVSNEVSELGHSGGTANCEERAKCTVCGEEYGELAAHTYSEWIEVDETSHKHTCECGYEESASHMWNDGEITKQPTHTDFGETTFNCDDCGATKTEQIEKTSVHTYGNWVKVDDTTHKHTCECGEHETENHLFGDWVITKESSESETGVKEKSCVCGYAVTEEIPKKVVETDPSNPSTDGNDSNESESSNTLGENNDASIFGMLENIPKETIIIVGASIAGVILLVVICIIVKKKIS